MYDVVLASAYTDVTHIYRKGKVMLVYPEMYNFPLEMTCWEIMSRLERRNFDVPGIAVTTRDPWGNSRVKVRGWDFSLQFIPKFARLLRVATPGKEFEFWGNTYTLNLAVYAYTDWERDRDWFLDADYKSHGMSNGLPRYLKYQSQCDCSELDDARFTGADPLIEYMRGADVTALHTHGDRWSCPLMVFDEFHEIGYTPLEDEPTAYRTEEVMNEMQAWLIDRALSKI